MTRKSYTARPSERLWGAIRIWAFLFIASSVAAIGAFGYRSWLMRSLPADLYITELAYIPDYVPDAEAEMLTTLVASLCYGVTYVVSAVLVLIWYLRSVRNAHALSVGVETSPGWTLWWFILPLVSLWKPYSMTSELWRSSHAPDGWKRLPDPGLLRWWWGAVLFGGFVLTAGSIMSRSASTTGQLMSSEWVLMAGYGLQILAGVLFLRIGGPISRRQTVLITQGRVTPPAVQPIWAA